MSFKFDSLEEPQRVELLDQFSRLLETMLSAGKGADDSYKKAIFEKLKVPGTGEPISDKQFVDLLRRLYDRNLLKLTFGTDRKCEELLQTHYPELQGITVVSGSLEGRFAKAGAERFVRELFRIGKLPGANQRTITCGIVSGRTSGSVVRAAIDMDWRRDLNLDTDTLPKIRVLALNVCITEPSELANNATILAYELAKKINDESRVKPSGHDRHELRAQPYGLSAQLLVSMEELPRADAMPQTFEVVQYTEPFRVAEKLERTPQENDTELDLVLTGVGEPPSTSASIFTKLARELGITLDKLTLDQMEGDLAFAAINRYGEHVPLRHQPSGGGGFVESMFYSAVRLPILKAMAANRDKSVILVARGEMKSRAVRASLTKNHRYASIVILDEAAARGLL